MFVDHIADLSGGELAMLNLVEHLDRAKYAPMVALFADGPLVGRLERAGVDVRLVPLAPEVVGHGKDLLGWATLLRLGDGLRVLRHAWRLRRLIAEWGVDLVHTNSLKADVIGGLAARLAGVPVVWHVRDRIAPDYLPSAVVRVFRCLARWIPHHIIGNSIATLTTVGPAAGDGTVAYSGVVVGPSTAERDDAGDRPPVVGLVGRIAEWKGQHIFIRAAAAVRARYPQCRFQVIGSALFGDEPYKNHIRSLIQELGLDEAVELTGFQADVPAALARLDLLVHASVIAEPFGQVIVEGMAAGLPVVATNGGGVPEIVEDGVSGLLVPMGDADAMAGAICRLLDDRAGAAAIARAGQQRARERFSIGQTVERVQAVYDRLLRRSTRAVRAGRSSRPPIIQHGRIGPPGGRGAAL